MDNAGIPLPIRQMFSSRNPSLKRTGGFAACLVLAFVMAGPAMAAVPFEWLNQDVGGPSLAGSSSESDGTWVVTGSGADIWGGSDQFQFAYRQMTGDFDVSARVASISGGSNGWRKGGLMARATLNGNSRNACTIMSASNGTRMQVRLTDGAGSSSGGGGGSVPVYVRLVRSGNSFSGYRSDDGSNWVQQYSTQSIDMSDTIYVGFCVTSHNNAELTTYTFDSVSGFPLITNADGATGLSPTAATLNGNLIQTNGPTYVWTYWGTTDGDTNKTGAGSWGNVESFVTPQAAGAVSTNLTGLIGDTIYYYRFYASNTSWDAWAEATAVFQTQSGFNWDGDTDDLWGTAANWVGNDVPNAAGEYARFDGTGAGEVDINGSSYSIDSLQLWGGDYVLTNSGAAGGLTLAGLTNSAGDNAIAATVSADVTGTVAVTGGSLDIGAMEDFSADAVTLGGGALRIAGSNAMSSAAVNGMAHFGFDYNTDGDLDLNNNGGVMAVTPDGEARLTDGPGGRGLDFDSDGDFTGTGAISVNDNYMNLFLGYFVPRETGQYVFRINQDDDRSGMWIDLDQDGVFESTAAGLGSNRGEQLAWENQNPWTVDLVAGGRYMFAVTHREGGGGSGIHAMFQTPSMSSEATIKPTDPEQVGMWVLLKRDLDATGLSDITVTADSALTVAAAPGSEPLMIDGGTFGSVTLSAGTLTASTEDSGGLLRFSGVSGSGNLTATGSRLQLDTASSMGTLTAGGGGDVTGATVTASAGIVIEPEATVYNTLTGSAYLRIGDSDSRDGLVELLANNSYSGETQIERGTLDAEEGVGITTTGCLRFLQGDNRDQTAVFQSSGTFIRNIGNAAGEVYWDGHGGFAARGAT